MSHNAELEDFMDESISLGREKGYIPTTFMRMREEYGTIETMKKLIRSGDIQSGFRRLLEIDLLDWSIEAAVLKFPDEFTEEEREAARWRLEQVGDK